MKLLICFLLLLSCSVLANDSECKKDSDCEVVKTLTRCDVDKQKLRNRIAELERQVKEQPTVIHEKEYVEEEVIKKNILSLYTYRDVSKVNASTLGPVGTAEVETSYQPGLMYQYQFDMGLVPAIGVNTRGNFLFGLGYEF